MKTFYFRALLIAFMAVYYSDNILAQDKVLFVIFTSIQDGEGMIKGFPPLMQNDKYQSIVYSTTSNKNKISYPFIHVCYNDRSNNLEIWDKPQSYLNDVQSTIVDWDVIKQGFTHKMDIIRLLRTWKIYDRIFFIDRNDFYTKRILGGLITQKRMVLREVRKDIDF